MKNNDNSADTCGVQVELVSPRSVSDDSALCWDMRGRNQDTSMSYTSITHKRWMIWNRPSRDVEMAAGLQQGMVASCSLGTIPQCLRLGAPVVVLHAEKDDLNSKHGPVPQGSCNSNSWP